MFADTVLLKERVSESQMAVKLLLIDDGRKMILNIQAIATILPEEILESHYISLVLFACEMQHFEINISSTLYLILLSAANLRSCSRNRAFCMSIWPVRKYLLRENRLFIMTCISFHWASNIILRTQFWDPLFLANRSWGILVTSGEQPRLENYRMPNWPKMTGPLGSAKQENHVWRTATSGEQPHLENYRMPNWPKMTGPLGSAKQENNVWRTGEQPRLENSHVWRARTPRLTATSGIATSGAVTSGEQLV